MRTFAALLALDARLLLKRALFRTVAAASILAAVITVLASGGTPGGGWWRLAKAVQVVIPLLLSFGAILGAVSLAGDAAAGSLRSVLMRPVSRPAVVVSRAVVLTLGLTAVYSASVLLALALSALLDRFDAITHGVYHSELISRAELLDAVPRLIVVAIPALVCSALIGLMVSAWWNDPSSSTICALLLVLSPYLLATLFDASTPWVFTHGATLGASIFSDLAKGITTRLGVFSDPGVLLGAVCAPAAAGVAAVLAGSATFSLRDFKG